MRAINRGLVILLPAVAANESARKRVQSGIGDRARCVTPIYDGVLIIKSGENAHLRVIRLSRYIGIGNAKIPYRRPFQPGEEANVCEGLPSVVNHELGNQVTQAL